MKKVILSLITVLLLLALCACGGGNNEQAESSAGVDAEQFGGALLEQLQQRSGESGEAEWVEVGEDTPFGQYRSVDELRAIIEDGGEDTNAMPHIPETPEPVEIDEANTYSAKENTVTFSDDGWGEGIEKWDWRSELTPEQLAEMEADGAEWAEMQDELDRLEGLAGEAMEQYGDLDIPEEYADMLEGLDLNDLLGGMDLSGFMP